MRVLITGATGFVGQHLTRLLSSKVELFGTFLRGDAGCVFRGIKLLHCDVTRDHEVRRVMQDIRPQQVYHLAALSSVRRSFNETKAVYDTNFLGTLNLFEAIRAVQPSARILFVGSAHCYGRVKSSRLPVSETELLAPESPYGVSKAAADMLAGYFFENYCLQVIRARPFNHTGPGQPPDFVCSDFARQFAAIGLGLQPPFIRVGNLRACRDFCDVRDVVRAYSLLMRSGKPGGIYNVGSGRAVSVRQIFETLSSLCTRRVQIKVEQQRLRRGDVACMYANTCKLRVATGWRPRFQLADTLRDLYLYWVEELRRKSAGKRRSVQSVTPDLTV